ncbi:unnamed protein product, partial [Laminaria digitata]
RSGEDNAVSRVLLQAIAEAAGVTVPSGFKSDHLFLDTRGQADGGGGGGGICNGSNSSNGGGGGDHAVKAALPRGATVILPGSFNPLHRGHIGLLEAARRLGSGATKPETKVAAVHGLFELSVANADKGGMAVEEIRRRARQFGEAGGIGCPSPLLISRAPLFSQKVGGFL